LRLSKRNSNKTALAVFEAALKTAFYETSAGVVKTVSTPV